MPRLARTLASLACVLVSCAFTACSGDSSPSTGNACPTDGGVLDDGNASVEADSSDDGNDAATTLTDEQIVTILHVSNQGEIQAAQLALTRAVDAQVRDFANMMIADHTAADAALATLFSAADAAADADAALDAALSDDGGLPIAQSAISATLLQESMLEQQMLMLKNGAAFDLAYMSGQVAMHAEVLQLIDTVLLPAASSAAVKTALMQARTLFATHLQHAVRILDSLATAALPD